MDWDASALRCSGADWVEWEVEGTMRIMRTLSAVLLAALAACQPAPTNTPTAAPFGTEDPKYTQQRHALVESGVAGRGVEDPEVNRAMRAVPRHLFVPEDLRDRAYRNVPLPIGHGQTISQPYIVGLMTEQLGVEAGDEVLEIGTGSGYQAAVLAEMGVRVYTIEIIGALAESAESRLHRLGYEDVQVRHADGYFGWEGEAPFDGIIVTAAPDHVPQPLLEQLAIEATMVVPVGPVGGFQELWRISRTGQDDYQSVSLGGVRFVPLTREER
jgi:protein-L-isoaspartate(D-aspartate) O-methyltransferase